MHRLVPFALTRPSFTVQDALAEVGGTFASVNVGVRRLLDAGILTLPDGRRRDRLFRADAVLDCFDRFRAARDDQAHGPVPGP